MLVLLLAVTACSAPAPVDAPASSSAAPSDEAVGSVPQQLRGTWLVDLTTTQIRHDLAATGFGQYADRFIRAEELQHRVRLAVTYTDDSFEIAWHRSNGTWYVGWYGTAQADAELLSVTDAETHATDVYAWRATPTRLVLRFRRTTTPDQKGIPFEAYSRAYFSRPLQRGHCIPANLDACWDRQARDAGAG